MAMGLPANCRLSVTVPFTVNPAFLYTVPSYSASTVTTGSARSTVKLRLPTGLTFPARSIARTYRVRFPWPRRWFTFAALMLMSTVLNQLLVPLAGLQLL